MGCGLGAGCLLGFGGGCGAVVVQLWCNGGLVCINKNLNQLIIN